ncbi:hypothetical protein MTO96_032014 [Rhipicephalus appendiculatus]
MLYRFPPPEDNDSLVDFLFDGPDSSTSTSKVNTVCGASPGPSGRTRRGRGVSPTGRSSSSVAGGKRSGNFKRGRGAASARTRPRHALRTFIGGSRERRPELRLTARSRVARRHAPGRLGARGDPRSHHRRCFPLWSRMRSTISPRSSGIATTATNAPPSAAACGDAGLSFVDADVESQSNCDDAGSLDAFTALLVVATLSALLEPSPVVASDSELEVSGFASRERCPFAESLSTLSRGVRRATLFVGFRT